MKSFVKFFILAGCICLLNACEDDQQTGKKPNPILKDAVTITPTHGGAIITYSIPKDPTILYVMAEYNRNGKSIAVRSSVNKNSLIIEGLNTTNPVSVTLYTVSRNDEIKSDPLMVDFTPLESPINMINRTSTILIGFGGVVVAWENPAKTELGVRLRVDSLGTMLEKDMYFSDIEFDSHAFRGFEDVETTFVVNFEDKWGNVSETKQITGTPHFETEVAKPWSDLRTTIPYDNIAELYGTYHFEKVWDGVTSGDHNVYLSVYGQPGCSMTFDLGQVVKLSRMAMWPNVERHREAASSVYGQVHIHEFEMWGTKALDPSKLPPSGPDSYWLHPLSAVQTGQTLPDHTFMDDWVYLGRYTITRLDLLGESQEAIYSQGEAGHHFEIPIEYEPVRIIRFFPLNAGGTAPPSGNYWQIGELSFWGNTKIPQD